MSAPNLPSTSGSMTLVDTLIDFVKQQRVLSPIRERHLRTHPDALPVLVEHLPGGAKMLTLPETTTVVSDNADLRRLLADAIARLDRMTDEQERHTDGIAVLPIDEVETQVHMAVLPVPMTERVTVYHWHSILPRNLRRMVENAVGQHLWQHGTHPARIRMSRRNATWARLVVAPAYRMHLRPDAKMDNGTIVCEGGEIWQK